MSKTVLSTQSLRLRWINCQCFELALPNGVHILTDPCYDYQGDPGVKISSLFKTGGFATPDLEGCDYVILNHTHADHMVNLEEVAGRFRPTVICHTGVAAEVAAVTPGLPLTSVYPVDYNGRYYFDGFTMDTYHGSHKPQPATWARSMERADFISQKDSLKRLHTLGGFFNMNYLLTLENGFRVAFVGGLDDGAKEWLRAARPNVAFRNKLLNDMDVESVARDWLGFMGESHAQIVVPMHFEVWENQEPGFSERTFRRANQLAEEKGLPVRMLSPESGRWYSFEIGVSCWGEGLAENSCAR